MAPEQFISMLYDNKVDVFTYSMILYELLTLEKPWSNKKNFDQFTLFKYVSDGLRPVIRDREIPEKYIELINNCWDSNPSGHPSFKTIVKVFVDYKDWYFDLDIIEEEEFEKLAEEVKKAYEERAVIVQEQIMATITQIKEIERLSDKKISEWQSNVALLTVNAHINYLKSQYKRNKKITKFFNDVKQDVLKNIPAFLEDDSKQQQQQPEKKPCLFDLVMQPPKKELKPTLFTYFDKLMQMGEV